MTCLHVCSLKFVITDVKILLSDAVVGIKSRTKVEQTDRVLVENYQLYFYLMVHECKELSYIVIIIHKKIN